MRHFFIHMIANFRHVLLYCFGDEYFFLSTNMILDNSISYHCTLECDHISTLILLPCLSLMYDSCPTFCFLLPTSFLMLPLKAQSIHYSSPTGLTFPKDDPWAPSPFFSCLKSRQVGKLSFPCKVPLKFSHTLKFNIQLWIQDTYTAEMLWKTRCLL